MNLRIFRQPDKPFRKQIVVKAIIFDRAGRILLMRKPPSEWRKATKGYDLPGGKLEESDRGDVMTALQREIEEETGLKNICFLSTEPTAIEEELRAREGRVLRIQKYTCFVESPTNVQLSDEHDYYGWLTPDQLKTIKTAAKYRWMFMNFKSKGYFKSVFSFINLSRDKIGCPSNQSMKEWINQWRNVSNGMIEDIERGREIWEEWIKSQPIELKEGQ